MIKFRYVVTIYAASSADAPRALELENLIDAGLQRLEVEEIDVDLIEEEL